MVRFDAFEFDLVSGELRREGVRAPLQEQPARALAYLLQHSSRTVTRVELIEHLWGDGRHVQFDQGLNYCVRQIRIALDDRVAAPKYLATVGRRGYRWIAPARAESGRRWSWMRSTVNRPVPAWLAAASAAACLTLATLVTGERVPSAGRSFPVAPAGEVRTAIRALHTLSHALVEPNREGDAAAAFQTLWNVTTRLISS